MEMRISQIVDPLDIDIILTIIMLRARTISMRGPIRGRVVMPWNGDAMIAIFIERPLSGEPQDEYCCRRSLQSRTI